jgi:hypothetical protein
MSSPVSPQQRRLYSAAMAFILYMYMAHRKLNKIK